jgi:hypothetical protein
MTTPGDTPTNPLPSNTTKVEPKVKWSVLGTYLAGVVSLGLVNAFTADDNTLLIATLPDAIEPFILPLVPAVVAAVAGFFAKHQWRVGEDPGRRAV